MARRHHIVVLKHCSCLTAKSKYRISSLIWSCRLNWPQGLLAPVCNKSIVRDESFEEVRLKPRAVGAPSILFGIQIIITTLFLAISRRFSATEWTLAEIIIKPAFVVLFSSSVFPSVNGKKSSQHLDNPHKSRIEKQIHHFILIAVNFVRRILHQKDYIIESDRAEKV